MQGGQPYGDVAPSEQPTSQRQPSSHSEGFFTSDDSCAWLARSFLSQTAGGICTRLLTPTYVNAAKQESIVIELRTFVLHPVPARTDTPENFDQASIALFAKIVALELASKTQPENVNE